MYNKKGGNGPGGGGGGGGTLSLSSTRTQITLCRFHLNIRKMENPNVPASCVATPTSPSVPGPRLWIISLCARLNCWRGVMSLDSRASLFRELRPLRCPLLSSINAKFGSIKGSYPALETVLRGQRRKDKDTRHAEIEGVGGGGGESNAEV